MTSRFESKAKELETLLRLQSMPIGLRMIRCKEKIPKSAVRPKKDMGYHLSYCQVLARSRRLGMTIAETIEDMWCFEPVVGLGFVEPPEEFLEGHNRYPNLGTRTLEAGARWARNLPRFEFGLYRGIITGPLATIDYEPDIFMIYGSPSKMTQIMLAKNWLDGIDITVTLSSHAACVYYTVPAVKEQKWTMSLPCGGDLRRAQAEDYNMVFSAPISVLDDLILGLHTMSDEGFGLPLNVGTEIEFPLRKAYLEIGRSIGMHWLK